MSFSRSRRFAHVSVLIFSLVSTSVAHAMTDQSAPLTVKEQMRAHHVGDTISVSEVNGTKLRANIVSIGEASAVVKNEKGRNVEIAYGDVAGVRNGGLSRGVKICIVVVVVLVALGIVGKHV